MPVVAVVVVDANAMLGGKLLKSVLGSDSFDGGIIDLVVHKTHSEVMVETKMVQHWYRFLVSFPFNWTKNPTSVDTIWSTETVSPGLVAVKTL